MSSLKALVQHPNSSDQVLIPKCRTQILNLVTLTVLLNSGILYLNSLELLILLTSLNPNYSNATPLLFVQISTSLALTSGSRFDANAAGHVIFYYLATAATDTSNDCGREPLLYITWKQDFYTSYKVFNVT